MLWNNVLLCAVATVLAIPPTALSSSILTLEAPKHEEVPKPPKSGSSSPEDPFIKKSAAVVDEMVTLMLLLPTTEETPFSSNFEQTTTAPILEGADKIEQVQVFEDLNELPMLKEEEKIRDEKIENDTREEEPEDVPTGRHLGKTEFTMAEPDLKIEDAGEDTGADTGENTGEDTEEDTTEKDEVQAAKNLDISQNQTLKPQESDKSVFVTVHKEESPKTTENGLQTR